MRGFFNSLIGNNVSGGAGGPVTSPISPLDLTFTQVLKGRFSGEIDNNLLLTNRSTESSLMANDAVITNGSGVTLNREYSGNALNITKTGTGASMITFPGNPVGAFWCIEIVLDSFNIGGTGTYADIYAGLFSDNVSAYHGVFANFSFVGSAQSGHISKAGALSSYGIPNGIAITPSVKNKLYVFVTNDYISTMRSVNGVKTWSNGFDLSQSGKRPGEVGFLNGSTKFGILISDNYSGTKTFSISSIKASYFLGHGISDWSPVCWEDSEPYIQNGRAYYIASRKGMATSNTLTADQGCLGIYSMDLKAYDLKSEGVMFTNRNNIIQGDYSAYLTRNKQTLEWRLLSPSWGNLKNFIGMGTDLTMSHNQFFGEITGARIVNDNPLQINGHSNYDPCVYKHTDGYYYIGYSVNPGEGSLFLTYLVKTLDFVTFTNIPLPPFSNSAEGQKFVRVGGNVYMFVGIATNGKYDVFNLSGAKVGSIDVPSPLAMTQASHPCIIPYNKADGKTHFILLTMDTMFGANPPDSAFPTTSNVYSNGNHYIYTCPQTEEGYEYVNSPVIE